MVSNKKITPAKDQKLDSPVLIEGRAIARTFWGEVIPIVQTGNRVFLAELPPVDSLYVAFTSKSMHVSILLVLV